MKLHPINHDLPGTLWCGPSALSTSTGLPTSVIHQAIKNARPEWQRHKPVKGVTQSNLEKAASLLGYQLVPVFDYFDEYKNVAYQNRSVYTAQPTLVRFAKMKRAELKDLPVIVLVTGHYVTLQGRHIVDNTQSRFPIPFKTATGRRRRVRKAWRVVPITNPPTPTT